MPSPAVRILAISGSLRAASSNRAVVEAARLLAPAGVEVTIYGGLGELPHFNPDVEMGILPPAVVELRAAVGSADALLVSSPEYAHGVPGSLKNALDWLVGGPEFVGKPVALVNASPRSVHAQAQLAETVATMSGVLVHAACVALPLLGRSLDAAGIAADAELSVTLAGALAALAEHVRHFPPPVFDG
ncbi:MAG TPA: NADPH-dependent FMN reductase [Longimicrobium sp.]|jgi:NAD(P)H-dependent FMN reductase|nr:NADPH-dependent FMN reductase [Longimicrobium sp.]